MRTPHDCEHLIVMQVHAIHDAVIEAYGGSPGIRDVNLLESAVNAPQATAFGSSPFADLVEVAAAYLFYLCRNHPLIDGNKRVGMTAAIVFLKLNGVVPYPDSDEWEHLVLDVAASRIDRGQTTERLRKLVS